MSSFLRLPGYNANYFEDLQLPVIAFSIRNTENNEMFISKMYLYGPTMRNEYEGANSFGHMKKLILLLILEYEIR